MRTEGSFINTVRYETTKSYSELILPRPIFTNKTFVNSKIDYIKITVLLAQYATKFHVSFINNSKATAQFVDGYERSAGRDPNALGN